MALRLKVDPIRPEPEIVARAAEVLRAGGLVAFPTETVYGLGADAQSEAAVRKVFAAKGRPAEDPLIVHVLDVDGLRGVASHLPEVALRLAAAFWPGPLTLVVPRASHVPAVVAAGLDTVAVRAPSHAVARALIRAAGGPVAAPSANRFGHTSPTTADHVLADLAHAVDVVLDAGPTPVGVESTVLDCRRDPPVVLRPGGVSLESLAAVVPGVRAERTRSEAGPSRSPGRLPRHYAPVARLVLLDGAAEDVREVMRLACRALEPRPIGLLVADEDLSALRGLPASVRLAPLGPLGDDATVARRLYAALRELDATGVALILARDFGDAGLALAVRDRLRRAARGAAVACEPGAAAEALAAVADAE